MKNYMDLFTQASDAWERDDFETAFSIFKTLSEQRDDNLYVNLGILYESGLGVTKDIDKALYWYKKSWRANGQADSRLNIADLYYKNGNWRAALYWWEKGILQQDGEAALELAKIYLTDSARRSLLKAKQYLVMAIEWENITEASKEEAEELLSAH